MVGIDVRQGKGYDFALLDQLRDKGFISDSHGTKSMIFTEAGIARAKLLKEKYLDGRSTGESDQL